MIKSDEAFLTAVQPNYFVAGVQSRINPETGKIECLVFEYTEDGRTSLKFPGGTNRLSKMPLVFRTNESPVDTLRREWNKEVGQTMCGCNATHALYDKGGGHQQIYILLEESDATGVLRTVPMTDTEPGRSAEHLGPPKWMALDDLLLRKGSEYYLHRSHHQALNDLQPTIEAMMVPAKEAWSQRRSAKPVVVRMLSVQFTSGITGSRAGWNGTFRRIEQVPSEVRSLRKLLLKAAS